MLFLRRQVGLKVFRVSGKWLEKEKLCTTLQFYAKIDLDVSLTQSVGNEEMYYTIKNIEIK